MNSYLLPLFISRLCSSRALGPVAHITVVLGWLENLNFFVEIIRWAHWISQVQSTVLPSIFLRAQPWISYRRCGEKLIKYQANSSWVIMSVILMTTLFNKALILQGEIWCWSLLGLKRLNRLHHAQICYIFGKLRRVFESIEFQKKAQFYYLRLHVVLASKLFSVVCCLGWQGWKCVKTF